LWVFIKLDKFFIETLMVTLQMSSNLTLSEPNFRLALAYQKMNEGGCEILDAVIQNLVEIQNRPGITLLLERKENAENDKNR